MVTCRQPVVIPVKRLQLRALFSHRSNPLFLNVWARETTAPGVALDPPVKETSNQTLTPVPILAMFGIFGHKERFFAR